MGFLARLRRVSPVDIVVPTPMPEEKEVMDDLPTLPKLDAGEEDEDNAAIDVVADMLYRSCWPLGWMPFQQVESEQWIDEVILGVSIRTDSGHVRSCPAEHDGLRTFEVAIELLHATVALKFTCKAVEYMVKYYLCVQLSETGSKTYEQ